MFKFDYEAIGLEDIKPAKNFIPDWYKGIKTFNTKNIEFQEGAQVVKTVKNCIPFLDGLTHGYTIELWVDVYCEKIGDKHIFTWQEGPIPLEERSNELNRIPVPAGHSNEHFAWKIPYAFNLPTGYSMLATHPLNNFDLPFTTLSGIVDADYHMNNGNLPFFIKEDFTGIIKKGTPICQLMPFKRENWKSERDRSLFEKSKVSMLNTQRVFFGWYKNNIWKKKSFE